MRLRRDGQVPRRRRGSISHTAWEHDLWPKNESRHPGQLVLHRRAVGELDDGVHRPHRVLQRRPRRGTREGYEGVAVSHSVGGLRPCLRLVAFVALSERHQGAQSCPPLPPRPRRAQSCRRSIPTRARCTASARSFTHGPRPQCWSASLQALSASHTWITSSPAARCETAESGVETERRRPAGDAHQKRVPKTYPSRQAVIANWDEIIPMDGGWLPDWDEVG